MKFKSRLENNIDPTRSKIINRARQNLLSATTIWHNEIVNGQLTGQRSGRVYRIPGTRRTYRASSPGEPPASRMGILRNGYRFQVVTIDEQLTGEVGSPEMYAVWLEKGTSKRAARPHVVPAFDKRRSDIYGVLGLRWDR